MAGYKTMEKSAKTMPAVGDSSETNSVSGDATENKSVVGGNTQSKSAVGDDTDSMSVEVKDTDRKHLVRKDRETNSLVEGTEKKSLGKGTVAEEPVVKEATEEREETAATDTVVEESTEETVVEATEAVVERGAEETIVETEAEKTLVEETRLEETRVEEMGVKEMGVQETFVEKGAEETVVEKGAEEPHSEKTRAEETRAKETRAKETRAEETRAEETGEAEAAKTAVEEAGKKTAAQNRLSAPVNSNGLLVTVGIIGFLLAYLVSSLFQTQPPPKQQEEPLAIFRREVQRMQSQFPSQRPELWRRSRIHLERHLQTAHPTEPVSLILTAGTKAEKTLHCLAQRLASAFSSALNASVLNIDGASKASQDSDQVKLEIDGQLRRAFEGDQPVAVIHRFEELPPGSTLIFYRYCDHENAAYKNVFLAFTVLLGGEKELQANLALSVVEEMVDDHLKSKFLSSDQPTSFDTMDLDKFSGLWSRISHLILPVAEEKTMELEGCGENGRNQSSS